MHIANCLNCLYYVVFLLSLKLSLEMETSVVVKSAKKHCSAGLVALKDLLELDITVVMAEDKADQIDFTMMAVDKKRGQMKRMCVIKSREECALNITEGCYCDEVVQNTYHIKYRSYSHVKYRQNTLSVNDKELDVTLPNIFTGEKHVDLEVNGNPIAIMQDCKIPVPQSNKTIQLHFCAPASEAPKVNITYGSYITEKVGKNSCVTSYLWVDNLNVNISIQYSNECQHSASYVCQPVAWTEPPITPVEIESTPETTPPITTFAPPTDKPKGEIPAVTIKPQTTTFKITQDEEYSLLSLVLAVILFTIIAAFCLVFCYMNRMLCFREPGRGSRLTIESDGLQQSTQVDPTAPVTAKKSTSLTTRLTSLLTPKHSIATPTPVTLPVIRGPTTEGSTV